MVDVDDKNEWKECIDIGGVRLPTGYYFGASAATGDLSGNPCSHKDILCGHLTIHTHLKIQFQIQSPFAVINLHLSRKDFHYVLIVVICPHSY